MTLTLPSGATLTDAELANAKVVIHTAVTALKGDAYQGRAVVACLACCLVESGLRIYANTNVATSLQLPHQDVGSDHASVGLFQQQVPSWGITRDCMDPAAATLKFLGLDRYCTQPGLTTLPRYRFDYVGHAGAQHWFDLPIGTAVQAVQVSAFPTRYEQRVADARAIVQHFAAAPQEDDLNQQQTQALIDQSLRDLAFGTNGPRHASNPHIAPDPNNGIFDLLTRLGAGLSAVAKQAKTLGVDVGGLDKDVASLQTQINAVKAQVAR